MFVSNDTRIMVKTMLTKSVVDADCPSHSLLTLNGREYFCRVLECNGAFSQGVADGEEVDESSRKAWLVQRVSLGH